MDVTKGTVMRNQRSNANQMQYNITLYPYINNIINIIIIIECCKFNHYIVTSFCQINPAKTKKQ